MTSAMSDSVISLARFFPGAMSPDGPTLGASGFGWCPGAVRSRRARFEG